MTGTTTVADREETIATADDMLEAAGLPTYTQLLVTIEHMATKEQAA